MIAILQEIFTNKPAKLLPLIQGYEVLEGNLVKRVEEVNISNKSDLAGEVVSNNMTNPEDEH